MNIDHHRGRADELHREMFIHLAELRDRCETLLASKCALDVYNKINAFRSLVGQIDSAATRWRDES